MELNDIEFELLAMSIVNYTNKINNVSVKVRQKNNDNCFDFAKKSIEEFIQTKFEDNEKLTPFDYLAQLINEQESIKNGYSYPVKWLALKSELKEKYLKIAEELYNNWVKDELFEQNKREQFEKNK
jgi:hypothetical protein